jgi:chaperone modulatory protein CbpM
VTTAFRSPPTRLVVRRVDVLAREAGVHPELVRRLAALGLIELDAPFADDGPRLARAVRLRRDLGLNYAGALLAGELLDRIDDLARRLRRYEPDQRR